MAAASNSSASQNNKIEKDEVRKLTPRSKNKNKTSLRQFLCNDCRHWWWKRVSDDRQASTCRFCDRNYRPVPKDREWGWASFECSCGKTFSGFAQKNVSSACYKCGEYVFPWRVDPPRRQRKKKSLNGHSCSAANCFSKKGTDNTVTCVHPKSGDFYDPSLSIAVEKGRTWAKNAKSGSSKAKRN